MIDAKYLPQPPYQPLVGNGEYDAARQHPTPPQLPPKRIARARLTADLYTYGQAAATLFIQMADYAATFPAAADNYVQQDGLNVVVQDPMGFVPALGGQADSSGDLRLPSGTWLYVWQFDDNAAYWEPL